MNDSENLTDKIATSNGDKPFKFKTTQALKQGIDSYFADPSTKPWCMAGLAVHLGTTRCTLLDYRGRNGYDKLIIAAKAKIEAATEQLLMKEKGPHPGGVIFNLANNYGRWYQKTEQKTELKVEGQIGVSINWVKKDASSC